MWTSCTVRRSCANAHRIRTKFWSIDEISAPVAGTVWKQLANIIHHRSFFCNQMIIHLFLLYKCKLKADSKCDWFISIQTASTVQYLCRLCADGETLYIFDRKMQETLLKFYSNGFILYMVLFLCVLIYLLCLSNTTFLILPVSMLHL